MQPSDCEGVKGVDRDVMDRENVNLCHPCDLCPLQICPNLCKVRDWLVQGSSHNYTVSHAVPVIMISFLPFIATSPHDHSLSPRPPAQDDSKKICVLPSQPPVQAPLAFRAVHRTI